MSAKNRKRERTLQILFVPIPNLHIVPILPYVVYSAVACSRSLFFDDLDILVILPNRGLLAEDVLGGHLVVHRLREEVVLP